VGSCKKLTCSTLSKEEKLREAAIVWLDRFFSLVVFIVILLLAAYK
jgi:hypothetical protein